MARSEVGEQGNRPARHIAALLRIFTYDGAAAAILRITSKALRDPVTSIRVAASQGVRISIFMTENQS